MVITQQTLSNLVCVKYFMYLISFNPQTQPLLGHCDPYFTDEEINVQSLNNLAKVTVNKYTEARTKT